MVITLGISIKFKNFVALTNSIRIVFFFPIIIKFKNQKKNLIQNNPFEFN